MDAPVATSREHLEALWLIASRIKYDYKIDPSQVSLGTLEAVEAYEKVYGEITFRSKPFWLTQGS